ncbi:MAG: dihydrolipoyl dehydrogenase [Candidatus Nanohaloarchaea archaeon]
MEEYDLIVLGAGSGSDVASGIYSRGKQVAIVEPARLGGTCLNRGCIPSKMLIHHADVVQEIRGSEEFHIDSELKEVEFDQIVEEVNSTVHGKSDKMEKGLKNSDGPDLYKDEARFVDEKTVELKDSGEKLKAEKIVVSAGSRPFVPPVDGTDEVDYWVSTDALNPGYQPESIIMIGGGYISLELAHFYDAMGTEVTILERGERVLKREDIEVSEKITEIAGERYQVELEVSATGIEEADGEKRVYAEDDEGNEKEFYADEILFATGRLPNTDSLEVENAGIETTDRGFIVTDEHMETSVDGIYALGDIADNWMFKHSANYEAEIVFKNLVTGNKYKLDYENMPHAVFTSPQIAGVGKTEQELEEEGTEYSSTSFGYDNTGMGQALKEDDGFVKLLTTDEGEILGCHIIGPEASTLIHEVLVSMRAGSGNIEDLKDTIHIHPALSEVVQRACNQL